MGFSEKSAWACLVSIVLVFAPYLWIVFQHPMAFMGLFPLAVIVLVVLLTAFHMVNAIMTRSIRQTGDVPPFDELDRKIELRAAKLSGIVLAVAVVLWCPAMMFYVPVLGGREVVQASVTDAASAWSHFRIPVFQVLTAIHLLFAGFVIANTVYYGSIIAGYRRMTHE